MPHGGGGAILRSNSVSLEMGASLSSSGSSAMLDREAKSDGGLPRVVSVQRMRAVKPYQKLFRQVGWTNARCASQGGAAVCRLRRMHVQIHAFGR